MSKILASILLLAGCAAPGGLHQDADAFPEVTSAFQILVQECPPKARLVNVTVGDPGPFLRGVTTNPAPGCFDIIIESSLEPWSKQETLCHEWAHVLVSEAGPVNCDDHGPLWGVAYAECYRALWGD